MANRTDTERIIALSLPIRSRMEAKELSGHGDFRQLERHVLGVPGEGCAVGLEADVVRGNAADAGKGFAGEARSETGCHPTVHPGSPWTISASAGTLPLLA